MQLIRPRQLVGALRCGLSWAWRGETHRTYFDPFNGRELNPVLARHGVEPPSADPSQAERGREGAARFVLGLYAGSPRLRRRFPTAFTETENGPFCRWLLGEASLGLSAGALGSIRGLFACNYGSRAARAWEAHRDLREELPFALTPFERGKFLDWLLAVARPRYGLADEELLWHLWELACDPACGLERTFRYTPEWQREFPDALMDGWQELKRYVGGRMGFVSRWLRRATISRPDPAARQQAASTSSAISATPPACSRWR